MSKRLQVLFDEEELAEIKAIARLHRMTAAEWVRQTLREARQQQPLMGVQHKLAAVAKAVEFSFPVDDIDKMLVEIERGYLSGPSE